MTGEQCREARERMGWTRLQLATATDVPLWFIAAFEDGKATLSRRVRSRFARRPRIGRRDLRRGERRRAGRQARQKEAAKMTATTAMEPLLPEEAQGLENYATDLVAKTSALAGRINPILAAGIGNLVRSMNCYYSNLIEGHHTFPVDIDRALNNDYAQEPERQNLQKEARAHIEVQRFIVFLRHSISCG